MALTSVDDFKNYSWPQNIDFLIDCAIEAARSKKSARSIQQKLQSTVPTMPIESPVVTINPNVQQQISPVIDQPNQLNEPVQRADLMEMVYHAAWKTKENDHSEDISELQNMVSHFPSYNCTILNQKMVQIYKHFYVCRIYEPLNYKISYLLYFLTFSRDEPTV